MGLNLGKCANNLTERYIIGKMWILTGHLIIFVNIYYECIISLLIFLAFMCLKKELSVKDSEDSDEIIWWLQNNSRGYREEIEVKRGRELVEAK